MYQLEITKKLIYETIKPLKPQFTAKAIYNSLIKKSPAFKDTSDIKKKIQRRLRALTKKRVIKCIKHPKTTHNKFKVYQKTTLFDSYQPKKKKIPKKNSTPKNKKNRIINLTPTRERRIKLRKQGLSICEIAKKENVSQQAIYYALQNHAPELLSDEFLANIKQHNDFIRYRTKNMAPLITIKKIPILLELRKQKFSIETQVTYPQRPIKEKLWYLYYQWQNKGIRNRKNIGRIERKELLTFFSEEKISQAESKKTPYLSLNSYLDNLITTKNK